MNGTVLHPHWLKSTIDFTTEALINCSLLWNIAAQQAAEELLFAMALLGD